MQPCIDGHIAVYPTSSFLFSLGIENIWSKEFNQFSLIFAQDDATHEAGYSKLFNYFKKVYLSVKLFYTLFVNPFIFTKLSVLSTVATST